MLDCYDISMSLLPLFGFLLYSIYADRVMSVVCAGVRWTIVQCNEATQGTSLLSNTSIRSTWRLNSKCRSTTSKPQSAATRLQKSLAIKTSYRSTSDRNLMVSSITPPRTVCDTGNAVVQINSVSGCRTPRNV